MGKYRKNGEPFMKQLAYYWTMRYDSEDVYREGDRKTYLLSVRCVKY